MRVSDEQTCPDSEHSALARVAAAWCRSMSSRIRAADFPPSSRVHRAIRSPQIEAMRRPAAVDPVKVILSTRGSRTSSSDTSRSAVTTFITPAGRPIAMAASASSMALSGAISLGFRTTVQPDARAGPSFHAAISSGKFQGMIWPTTPTGSCRV